MARFLLFIVKLVRIAHPYISTTLLTLRVDMWQRDVMESFLDLPHLSDKE
jgi:hypothetical protein